VTAVATKFGKFWSWLTWQRLPVGQIPIRNPKRELGVLAIYAVIYVALSYATGRLIARWPHPLLGASEFTNDAWYAFGFKITALLVAPLVIFYRWGYRARDLLLDWKPTLRMVSITVFAFAMGFCINLEHFVRVNRAAAAYSSGELTLRIVVAVLLPLLTAGIPEEVYFRALLQTRLEALWGRMAAIVVSNLLFAAWHLPTRYLLAHGVEGTAGDFGSVLLGTGVPVFVVGLIFGWLWDRYRRLVPLVAAHWGVDVLPTVSSLLRIAF
jgi:membrane protease YdiL (CAAX protease family)